jgi:hypothetical protein
VSNFPLGLLKEDMREPLLQCHGVQLHYFVFFSISFF